MMFRNIVFKDLKLLLFNLGFKAIPTSGKHYIFEHPISKALVILPQYEDQAYVDRTHLVAVRRILIENGLIDEVRFDSILEKVPVTHCN